MENKNKNKILCLLCSSFFIYSDGKYNDGDKLIKYSKSQGVYRKVSCHLPWKCFFLYANHSLVTKLWVLNLGWFAVSNKFWAFKVWTLEVELDAKAAIQLLLNTSATNFCLSSLVFEYMLFMNFFYKCELQSIESLYSLQFFK